MKTEKSNKALWIASFVFIAATMIYIGIQHRRINRLSEDNQIQSIELSSIKDTVAVYKSKNGDLTGKINSVEVDNKNLKEKLEIAGFDIKELKQRDIDWRKITDALKLQIEATGSGQTTVTDTFRIVKNDTIPYMKVNDWSNNHLSLFNGEIFNKQYKFDYYYKIGVDFLTEEKRKGTVVSVILSDPKAEIISGNSITIDKKKKWFERPVVWALFGFGTGILISK